ncbi:MAG: hypothetical protein L0Z48_09885, partial [candidate division Zixibacteria bacterium]|nr:hypothetical protein [candidate division Zixibacteria bacterium]
MNPQPPHEGAGHPQRKKNPLERLKNIAGKVPQVFSSLARHFSGLFQQFQKPLAAITQKVKIPAPLARPLASAGEIIGKRIGPLWAKVEDKIPPKPRAFIQKHRRKIIAVLILLVSLNFIRGLLTGGGAKIPIAELISAEQKKEEPPVPVKGFKVGRFNYEDSLNALGTVKGAMEFKLSFEIPGVVSSVNYREGERYEEGALLISLRQDDVLLRLKRSQAELNKADTQVKIAQEKVSEHEKLFSL